MDKNDSDAWALRVFYFIFTGSALFMLAIYIFAFNS
jgi:hypothetical protein